MNDVLESDMIHFTIDGIPLKTPRGITVYHAAKEIGIEIPIFCYLDRMPPFGACRMCLIEVENMSKPQTACTLEVTEGMVVKTQSKMAEEGRKDIIEFLLLNHPLDCPICDRGGECPLQDNTMRYGPGLSHFFENKRHFLKALPLSPVLTIDRERCIVCARCTRFSDLLSGDHALEFIDRGYTTEVGVPDGKTADSKFIGNTIMICPVGALTSSVYRFRSRPWDNDSTHTSCTLCPVGCSMILDARDGEIMRTRSKENPAINDIWMCDKGWFGYEFSNAPDRLKHPLIRVDNQLKEASWEDAIQFIVDRINESKANGKLAFWGGNPLTTEENELFQQLARKSCGVNNVDHRVGSPLFSINEEGISPGMQITLADCESLSFALLLGIDLTEEFPVIWLRLRQAINKGAKVIFMGHFSPEIAPYLFKTILHPPGKELGTLQEYSAEIETLFKNHGKGAIFIGKQYLNTTNRQEILSNIQNIVQINPNVSINILEGQGNSQGARLAGMRPDIGLLGEKLEHPGLNSLEVLSKMAQEGWDFLYVTGTNPSLKFPSKLWEQARAQLGCLVVQDLFLTETAKQADVVLPSLCFMEKNGTFITIDGHKQQIHPGKQIPEGIYSDGAIFSMIAQQLGSPLTSNPHLTKILEQSTPLTPQKNEQNTSHASILTNNTPLSKGTFLCSFNQLLFDCGERMQRNPHLAEMVKTPFARIHPLEAQALGIQEGEIVELQTNEGIARVPIQYDKAVAHSTIVLPLGFEQLPIQNLGTDLKNGLLVKITLLRY